MLGGSGELRSLSSGRPFKFRRYQSLISTSLSEFILCQAPNSNQGHLQTGPHATGHLLTEKNINDGSNTDEKAWKSLFQKGIHDLHSQVPGVRIRRTRAVHSMTLERWALRFRPCIHQCQVRTSSSELSHILFRFVSIGDLGTPF